jgi:glycosyltransferase involved in cell wall biosynthesis
MYMTVETGITTRSGSIGRQDVRRWHLITSEYPPQCGGVSDYTHQLAQALAKSGDEVEVWCPAGGESNSGIRVNGQLARMRPGDLRRLGAALDSFPRPRKVLLQWVPHGYGYRSLNVAFCLWIWVRSVFCGDALEIMVHEPFLRFGEGTWKQDSAAVVHRIMTLILLGAASRVWVSTPGWSEALKPFALGRRLSFGWLPVPSNVPVIDDPAGVATVRNRFPPGMTVFGHFGTYGRLITDQLRQTVPIILTSLPHAAVLLIGPGSDRFAGELVDAHPAFATRVLATGFLSVSDVSRYISACDVMVQPYPDGVTTRRTSVMAALSHERAVITTSGRLTETLWAESQAVALHEVGDLSGFASLAQHLYNNPAQRDLLGGRAHALYAECFDIQCVVDALQGSHQSMPIGLAPCAS